MPKNREAWSLLAVFLVLSGLITAPYLYAQQAAGPDYVFGGFLLNPVDGNSYLAKILQGWEGGWLFRLPFTAEPGEGVFLFPFYLLLGHIAARSGLSLLGVFHLARVVSAGILVWSLYHFYKAWLPDRTRHWFALILGAFGSGFGWLALTFGQFTSDFWVAEAYPFLSSYANPHFPLSLGLMLSLLMPVERRGSRSIFDLVGAILLALISPFGALLVAGILVALLLVGRGKPVWALRRIGWLIVGAGPVGLYDSIVIRGHPALAVWNAQNLTPSPSLQDLLISFSPALAVVVLAGIAGRLIKNAGPPILVVWVTLVLLVIYLPFNLQRRMLLGFYIPIAGLASQGLVSLRMGRAARRGVLLATVLILSLPTNVVVLFAALHGAQAKDPLLYLTRGEVEAMTWLASHSRTDELVMAAPETGMFLASHTGRRVIYGHPFETVDAEHQKELVTRFFQGQMSSEEESSLLVERGVDFIFLGQREALLGLQPVLIPGEEAFNNGEVIIYRLETE